MAEASIAAKIFFFIIFSFQKYLSDRSLMRLIKRYYKSEKTIFNDFSLFLHFQSRYG